MTAEDRVERLQSQVQMMTQRVYELERIVMPVEARPAGPRPVLPPSPPPRSDKQPLELSPTRVLAATGGIVLLVGLGFLLRYAVVRGWLGPEVRVVLGMFGSAVLAGIGMRLERSDVTRV